MIFSKFPPLSGEDEGGVSKESIFCINISKSPPGLPPERGRKFGSGLAGAGKFMKTAYIGIGSNMADPRGNCLEAVKKIGGIGGCRVESVSALYLTEPVGVRDQEWYVNGALCLSTGLSPFDLIGRLLEIEADMGRVRTMKWGPRIIDLDILLFGQDIINDAALTVPHPMMHLRRFVMAPMVDLAPDLMHPVLLKTMIELYRELPQDGQVIKRVEGK